MSQVIKKRDIVIASVLKPVDDTRMFEKMAVSLANSGKFSVHIIGFPSTQTPSHPNVHLYPSRHFRRLHPIRFFISLRFFALAMKIRPQLIIINTHELLWTAFWLRILSPCRIIYDIRENYYRNILYLPTFTRWLRPVLAGYVRLKEKMLAPFIHHFILAEAGYRHELTFLSKRVTVIENKANTSINPAKPRVHPGKRLLFSGTLATSSGIFIAIDLAASLHKVDPAFELHIIGYCAQPGTLKKILELIKNMPFVTLTGGDRLVPHTEIVKAIASADYGIIAYPPNLSSVNTTPTKLFEYLASRLPILMLEHRAWIERCKPYNAAVIFKHPENDANALLAEMQRHSFYKSVPGPEIFWETEARRLVDLVIGNK